MVNKIEIYNGKGEITSSKVLKSIDKIIEIEVTIDKLSPVIILLKP